VTSVQVPTLPPTSQAWHWPLHAWSQQKPSTQCAFAHWLESVQADPSASFETQVPLEQYDPLEQSASTAHDVLQAVAPQANAPHDCVWAAGQEPLPHEAARVSTPALHEAPRHCDVGYAQAFTSTPSHDPPQAEPSELHACRDPCGAPLTAVHTPTLPGTSQAWHWPLHAVLQQTPSTQLPSTHEFDALQAPPSAIFGTHAPELHQSPEMQSESLAHDVLHALAPQTYWPQPCVCAAGHEPPLHEAASVSTPALHEAPRHCAVG
jgi:hypothetical protein